MKYFKNLTKNNIGDIIWEEVASIVRSEELKSSIEKLMSFDRTKKTEYSEAKIMLFPAVCVGMDTDTEVTHLIKNYKAHTGFISVDIDHISTEQMSHLMDALKKDKYVHFMMISPSRDGLKIIYKINIPNPEDQEESVDLHLKYYFMLEQLFMEKVKIQIDKSCKNVNRMMFLSYDPSAYFNANSEILPLKEIKKEVQISKNQDVITEEFLSVSTEITDLHLDELYNHLLEYKIPFPNQYNEWLALAWSLIKYFGNDIKSIKYYFHRFASLSNKYKNGFSEKKLTELISSYDERRNKYDIGFFFSKYYPDYTAYGNFQDENILKETPSIPSSVYDNLPRDLKMMLQHISDTRKKDALLTSILTSLSSCFPNVSTLYDEKRIYSNLYSFIVAPAASNKSVMLSSKTILKKYTEEIEREYKKNFEAFEKEIENNPQIKISKPNHKRLLIAGNSSHSAFIDQLNQNNGEGFLIESEADVLVTIMKNDWGNYSTDLRAAFHHECIQKNRVKEEDFVQIDNPKLSVCISGTVAQCLNLIKSAENGLFSRFLYYTFEQKHIWRSPFSKVDSDEIYYNLSRKVYDVIEHYKCTTHFELSNAQQSKFNIILSEMLQEGTTFQDESFSSSLYRLGIISIRLMMLLSIFRHYELAENLFTSIKDNSITFLNNDGSENVINPNVSNNNIKNIVCEDVDFDIVMELIKVYNKHTEIIYNNLNKGEMVILKKDKKSDLFSSLPNEFTSIELYKKAKEFDVSEATVKRMIGKLKEAGKVEKLNKITYKKVK